MKVVIKALILSLFTSVLLSSCSMQKRTYTKGYHIEWFNSATRLADNPKMEKEEINTIFSSENKEHFLASSDLTLDFINDEEPCDTIVFLDGKTNLVKIEEITDDEIRYKNCNNINGPTYVIDKSNVDLIIFSNGEIEHVKESLARKSKGKIADNERYFSSRKSDKNSSSNNFANNSGVKVSNTFASASILLSIIGFFTGGILSILGVIFGIVGLIQISNSPDYYRGRGNAIAGVVLGVLGMILMVFILLLF